MVIQFFLRFFLAYHDFYFFLIGNIYGAKMESLRNFYFMVGCSFYYHKIFQKNNLRVLVFRISNRLPCAFLTEGVEKW